MTTRRSLLPQLGVLGLGAAGAWWLREEVLWPSPSPVFADDSRSSGWLDFAGEEPVPVAGVKVNRAPTLALFDSGAQVSTLHSAFAAQIGLRPSPVAPVVAFGIDGAPRIGRSVTIGVEIGELRFERLRVAALDLGPIAEPARERVSLILGQDVLRVLLADIDFAHDRIALRDPHSGPPPKAVAARVRRVGRELLAQVELNGAVVDAVVDTGASAPLAVSAGVARTAGLLSSGGRAIRTPSITFGGLSEDLIVRADRLRFAGRTYEGVAVQVFGGKTGRRTPDALLGTGLLQDDRVWLDMGGARLDLVAGGAANG